MTWRPRVGLRYFGLFEFHTRTWWHRKNWPSDRGQTPPFLTHNPIHTVKDLVLTCVDTQASYLTSTPTPKAAS